MIRQYKVTCGSYRSRQGKIFVTGDIVESETDLAARFPNGFALLETADPMSKAVPTEDEIDLPVFAHPFAADKARRYWHIRNTATQRVLDTCRFKEEEECAGVVAPAWDEPWSAVPFWQGATVVIIGGGPSVKDLDLAPLEKAHVLGINDAYTLGDFVDVNFFGDWRWLLKHKDTLAVHPCMKVTSRAETLGAEGIYSMTRAKHGINPAPHMLPWGLNSGTSAIYLAQKLGAKRVILLGFDMAMDSAGQSNWHENNLTKNTPETYHGFVYQMKTLKEVFRRTDTEMEIINANPDSVLDIWPRISYEEAMAL